MREIGTIVEEQDALLFKDHLTAQKISSKVMPEKEGWGVWVINEDQVPQAGEELKQFLASSDRAKYRAARETAKAVAKAATAKEVTYQKNVKRASDRWEGPSWKRFPLTFGIIFACFFVAMMTDIGTRGISPYLISTDIHGLKFEDDVSLIVRVKHGFQDITRGQVWRLVTPIFLHFGVAHLVCNVMALRIFGAMVEYHKGWLKLLILVLVSAVISNVAQFLAEIQSEDVRAFGGMSGVGYALFGYLWTKGNWRPEEKMGVNSNTVFLMIAWFFFCMSGYLGPVANTAHGAGLVVGMCLGLTRF